MLAHASAAAVAAATAAAAAAAEGQLLDQDQHGIKCWRFPCDPRPARVWLDTRATRAHATADCSSAPECWSWVASDGGLAGLAQSLDDRGVHERQLQRAPWAHHRTTLAAAHSTSP